jgi:hypothetical protein
LDSKALATDLTAHTGDTSNPHSVTHAQLPDKGTNDHAAIDSHLANTSNPHSVTAAQTGADPTGTAAAAVSTHESTYNHASYDSHLANTSNPHSVTAAQAGAEPALGNPSTDGYVLSSTAAGVRSWIAAGGGGGGLAMAIQEAAPTTDGTYDFWFRSSDAVLFILYDSAWIGIPAGGVAGAGQTREDFIATAGQTVFSLATDVGATDGVEVYVNGDYLPPTDYTVDDVANTVTLAATTLNDNVSVVITAVDLAYVPPTPLGRDRANITASEGQTVFLATFGANALVDVYQNGDLLAVGDYVVGSNQITLATGATAGDEISIMTTEADQSYVPGSVDSFNGRSGAVVPAANDYAVADISGLQTALNGKSDTTHDHAGTYSEISSEDTLSGNMKFAVVTALPGTPDANTIYFVTG